MRLTIFVKVLSKLSICTLKISYLTLCSLYDLNHNRVENTMKITNEHQLPDAFLNFAKRR